MTKEIKLFNTWIRQFKAQIVQCMPFKTVSM